MEENLSAGRLEFLRDLAVQHPDNVILEGETVLALITRLEQAEQAVARVREVCEHFWPKALHQSVPLGVADSQSQIITSELLRALEVDTHG